MKTANYLSLLIFTISASWLFASDTLEINWTDFSQTVPYSKLFKHLKVEPDKYLTDRDFWYQSFPVYMEFSRRAHNTYVDVSDEPLCVTTAGDGSMSTTTLLLGSQNKFMIGHDEDGMSHRRGQGLVASSG